MPMPNIPTFPDFQGQEFPARDDIQAKLARDFSARVRSVLAGDLPRIALVLGSGLQGVLDAFHLRGKIAGAALPGIAARGVPGHAGEWLLAELEGLRFLICSGRMHYYEGHSLETLRFPVRALAACGVRELLLTNAAGGINPRYAPGDFMILADHINFMGVNPLRGLPPEGGRCFVDLGDAHSPRLRRELKAAFRKAGVRSREGVYLAVSGPSYETPAEIRAFRRLGADAVGMSTVPELLMARYCGLETAAISCITNRAAGLKKNPRAKLSHREVLAAGAKSAARLAEMLRQFAAARQKRPASRMIAE